MPSSGFAACALALLSLACIPPGRNPGWVAAGVRLGAPVELGSGRVHGQAIASVAGALDQSLAGVALLGADVGAASASPRFIGGFGLVGAPATQGWGEQVGVSLLFEGIGQRLDLDLRLEGAAVRALGSGLQASAGLSFDLVLPTGSPDAVYRLGPVVGLQWRGP